MERHLNVKQANVACDGDPGPSVDQGDARCSRGSHRDDGCRGRHKDGLLEEVTHEDGLDTDAPKIDLKVSLGTHKFRPNDWFRCHSRQITSCKR